MAMFLYSITYYLPTYLLSSLAKAGNPLHFDFDDFETEDTEITVGRQ
jgi:hypothetical protein